MQLKNRNFLDRYSKKAALGLTALCLFFSQGVSVHAENEIENRIAAHQAMEVQSNNVENWPTGPVVSAESAILIEAGTGAVLYEKNIHEKQYPASTTKILTTLIAAEQSKLDEIVEFSHDAVFSVPRDSNHIAMDEGEALSMEDCLNAILIRSANEVCNAVAEHIAGSVEAFADKMNERAEELGCLNSHFVNPNGLPDDNHYTTAYDLAQIGRAFFANEMLCRISTSTRLHILPTERQPDEKIEVSSNQLLPGGKYAYEYLVGTKTGYTSVARSALVSCAEKNGMKLICVVLNDESPFQYEDTIALFEYGFSNFDKINISRSESKYNIDSDGFFYGGNDIFGSSQPLLSLNKEDYLILPRTADFTDTVSSISYDTENENEAALISYTYHDVFIGSASLDFTAKPQDYSFDTSDTAETGSTDTAKSRPPVIIINVVKVLLLLAGIALLVFLLLLLRTFLINYRRSHPGSRSAWRRRRRRQASPYLTANESLQAKRREQIKAARRRAQIKAAKRRRRPRR